MATGSNKVRGLYQKNIVLGRKEDGSYMRKTLYGKTKKELEMKYIEITRDLNNGLAVWEKGMTFKELAYIWLDQYNPMANERWRYTQELIISKHILPSIGLFNVKDLRQIHLQTIISGMAKSGYSTRTMKGIKQTATRIMAVAVDSDLIMRNPFQGVKVPVIEAKERLPITPEQFKLVNEYWRGNRMGAAAMIMLYTGIRKGELLALKWEDIDLEKRTMRISKSLSMLKNQSKVKTPKTKAGKREIPIPNILLPVLIEVRKPKGLVCSSARNSPMTEVAYKRAWESYMLHLNESAGGITGNSRKTKTVWVIEKFTAHQLRHTYATMLFDANVDIKSAQMFLGHSDIEVTLNIYTHLSKFKTDEAIESLNGHLDKLSEMKYEC